MENKPVLLVLLAGCLAVAVWAKSVDQIYKNEKYVLYSGSDSTENDYSISVEGKRSFTFKLRACETAHVRMAAILDHESVTTDLTIGAEQNTKTYLTYVGDGDGKQFGAVDTPNILHCNELRTFWVSFAYGYFRFGRGSAIGVEMDLEVPKTDELAHDVSAISLFTRKGIAGVWEIEEGQFVNFVSTPAENNNAVPYIWRTVQHVPGGFFVFSVKACQNVDLYLGSSIGAGEYRIRIDQGGSATKIMKGDEELATIPSKVVDCDTFKTLWVTWWAGRIAMGSGLVKNIGTLIEVSDTGIDLVYAIGFGAGSNAQASFDIFGTIDEMYSFTTYAGSDYNNWMHVSESDFVGFSVQACKDVTIVFSDTLGTVSDNAFILEISPGGNDVISIKNKNGNTIRSETSEILDCEFSVGLWASFANNKFRVGKATFKGVDTLLAADAELDGRMTGIGFASNDNDQPAVWTIATIEPGVLRMTTDGNEGEYTSWASGTRRIYKEFRMKQCGDKSNIHLTPCLGCFRMGSTGSYHVVFEKEGSSDKVTLIRKYLDEETTIDTQTATDLTSCTEYRSFFVSWYEGRMTLGRGDLTSGEILVEMDFGDELPYLADAIAFDSSGKTDWEMPMETWEQLSFQRQASDVGYSWIKLSRLTFQRFWATGSTVDLFLCETYGQTDNGYKITITSGSSTISRNGQQVTQYDGKIIDNNHRSYLVLSWANGEIRLGPELGGTAYLTYKDESPMSITGMGVNPNGEAAEVRLPHTFVSETTFKTAPSSILTPAWMDLAYHDTLIFSVKCDGGAKIVLAPYMFHNDVNTYYIVTIGDNGNQDTTIRQTGQLLASNQTGSIISGDEETTFWMQWYHGEIILGLGEHIGNDVIVTYYDPSPAPITAAAFDGSSITEWTVGLVPYANLAGLSPPSTPGGGLSGGAIAGIVISVLFLVALIGGFIYMYRFGKLQSFSNSLPSPSARGSNKPEQFDNPLSVNYTNSTRQTAA